LLSFSEASGFVAIGMGCLLPGDLLRRKVSAIVAEIYQMNQVKLKAAVGFSSASFPQPQFEIGN
jgi:hypothetical protein